MTLSRKYKQKILILFTTVLIFGFILFESNISSPTENIVEKYDLVTIDYQMWESDNLKSYNPLNLLLDETIVVTVIPITDDKNNGLILGLFNNLVGKKLFYESDFIWLDNCVDQNRDGIDDIFDDKAALTYGNSTDQYFNMCLMIKFKILSIQKPN